MKKDLNGKWLNEEDEIMFCVNPSCKCCMNPRDDFWHCEDCWNKFHNGLKDKDWMTEREWIQSGHAERFIQTRRRWKKEIEKIVEWGLQ